MVVGVVPCGRAYFGIFTVLKVDTVGIRILEFGILR